MANNTQNIERELAALVALHNFLVRDFCDRLSTLNSRLRGYINMMEATGIQQEECVTFREKYYIVDESYFKRLYERIVEYDLPQIRKYIEQIEKQFQAAKGSSHEGYTLMNPMPPSAQIPSGAIERGGTIQDYEKQIEALCDFMDYLVMQRNELQGTILQYERYCNSMLENGVPRQVVDHYVPNYAIPNVRAIKTIIDHIESADYVQLKSLYIQTSESLNGLGITAVRTPHSL